MHKHIYIEEIVKSSEETKKLCKLMYSKTDSLIYNKFIIPEGRKYLKCIKCDKIKIIKKL